MKMSRPFRRLSWLGFALTLMAGAPQSQAQTAKRSVGSLVNPQAPAMTSGAASTAAPNPTGPSSPITNTADLPSRFPTGLSLPSAKPPDRSPTAVNTPPPKTPTGEPAEPAGVEPKTPAVRASRYGQVESAAMSPVSGPYTALQIAQSFLGADANRDGELTPAEAERLTIMPYSFEDMDRNRNRILTRSEYEDAVRRGPENR